MQNDRRMAGTRNALYDQFGRKRSSSDTQWMSVAVVVLVEWQQNTVWKQQQQQRRSCLLFYELVVSFHGICHYWH
jgi:uncharacterized membrane protein YoaT (DUF817 family)